MIQSPLSSSARVLCICPDTLLRNTRQLVLLSRYVAVSVATVEEMRLLAGEDFDVVIVCHALRPEECDAAVQLAHMQWPQVHVIVLTRSGKTGKWETDNVVRTAEGPEILLSTIDRLLHMPKRPVSTPLVMVKRAISDRAAELA